MKILEDNYNGSMKECAKTTIKPYPRQCTCDGCDSILEYDKSDLYMGFLGCMYLRCPLCGEENMLEDNEGIITLTKDNVEFPVHFWHISKESGATDCCNNETVKKSIDEAISYLREHKDENWYGVESGNLYVNVCKLHRDKNYDVCVSNDYYNTVIPFEKEDY